MKIYRYLLIVLISSAGVLPSCQPQSHDHGHSGHEGAHHEESEEGKVHFSMQQFAALGMRVDTVTQRNMASYVEANGQLEVPPQNEAAVTAIIGANVASIKVIEGDEVKKGQVLAYLSHPNLIQLQTDYIQSWNQLQYLEQDYKRQEKLYEEKVGAGKEFQKTKADFLSTKAATQGLESQLKLLGLNIHTVQSGKIYSKVPVYSPISGYVRLVEVKTGQYVQPQTEMFELVNVEHIHADLMVFERDVHKVSKGQKVHFSTESLPDIELVANIYAVGKAFEQNPKAIHIHAEIENKVGQLIPGMYVNGRIITGEKMRMSLPNEAVVRDGDRYYVFAAEEMQEEWEFVPKEVVRKEQDGMWTAVEFVQQIESNQKVAWNNAYYLLAELKKSEAGHDH
ncbi:efflux RND transporter periplasmic adaptor subunit [Reichenbachiella ulvae]|uniref:Efflux RND transporter periplasmic adaptor subunit n=1 Tax=Reichenbachiella ulvae TaxID=2980104 RepID=A0ABT3CNV3_9BACT|nr:efflux RND transporter periplasmic adaptor subunit [Reichenbachiella ulvae]MCV9385413.1 efflux RND transporter periplasmic adaptor subunit [Reichenbachiella ulvae]